MRSFCLGDEADKWTDDHRLSSWLSPRVKIRILFFLFYFFFRSFSMSFFFFSISLTDLREKKAVIVFKKKNKKKKVLRRCSYKTRDPLGSKPFGLK